MKKIYFLFTFLIASVSFAQSPIITAIIDGDCSGGTPKLLEIYADGTVDFTLYSLENQTNANTGAFGNALDLSALGTVTDDFVYITTSSDFTILSTEFPSVTFVENSNTLVSNVMNLNGDDRIRIIETSSTTVIDQYGVSDVDGTGTTWEYLDSYAKRLDGTGPDGGFTEANWDIPGASTIDGGGTCQGGSSFESMMGGIGTYSTTGTTSPTINVGSAVTGLDYFEGNGPSNEGNFTVSGINLTANVTVTAPTNFEVSLTSGSGFGSSVIVAQSGGTAPTTTVYTRLIAGLLANSYSGNVTASSSGATDATVALSGTVSPATPQITIGGSVDPLNYSVGNGPSNEDSFVVSGLFLTTDITVTAPTNFEVSLTSGSGFGASITLPQSGGTVSNTSVYVRLMAGQPVNSYSGDVTASATGATDQTIAVSGNVYGAATNSLVITGVFDGPLTGGTPKLIEFYAISDIADLSVYGVESANNGNPSAGVEYTFPSDAITAGSYIYFTYEGTNTGSFFNYFGVNLTYDGGSVANNNGDDAIILYENGVQIDVFGVVGTDGTGEDWDSVDGWAYRNDNTGPDGSSFVLGNWSFSGVDATDGCTTNGSCTSVYPIGTYSRTLSTDDFAANNFKVYPNPTSTGFVNITSNNSENISVAVFDILGKQVINKTISNNILNVSALNSGVYIMKISQNNATVTKKLVIK